MTWRRRLLIATATLGGGIICFQPLMRARMESRLSDIVGGRVEIGSSKISVRDGAIALRDIIVHPNVASQSEPSETAPAKLMIQHAALKFNWKSLLYRNLTLENVIASDVRWEVVEPTSESVPTATEKVPAVSIAQGESNVNSDIDIASIVQPLKLKMADVAAKQSQTHLNISSRIKSVLERLAEIMDSTETLNVLRQSSVLDEAQKALSVLKQPIAEARQEHEAFGKTLDSLIKVAQKSLVSSLEIDPGVVSSTAKQSASQLATLAVAKEWNRNRPLIHAALNSISVLQPMIDPLRDDRAIGNGETRSKEVELLAKLPVGLTRCVTGKAMGVAHFPGFAMGSPEASSAFEIRFRNLCSTDLNGEQNPTVTIKMTKDVQPDGIPWLFCSAQQLNLPQSDAKQVHFVIERMETGISKSITTIQHANQGWAATVSVPIASCVQTPSPAGGLDIGSVPGNSMVIGKLIGTTHSGLGEANEMLIDVEDSSLAEIEAMLSPMLRSESEKKKTLASIRGTELLNRELLQISSRWNQLGDEHARAHGNWETSIQEVNEKLTKLKKAFTRTTRTPSPPAR